VNEKGELVAEDQKLVAAVIQKDVIIEWMN
jgi:hypothetical protein